MTFFIILADRQKVPVNSRNQYVNLQNNHNVCGLMINSCVESPENFNLEILQCFQFKVLRAVINSPKYLPHIVL